MTVASATNRARYDGDGTSTVFAVPFYFLEPDDLKLVRSDADGSETVLTPGIDYSVAGAGDPAGGSVTLTAPPAAGQEIVILRDIAPTQGTDFEENADLPAETLERGFDRLTMLIQQIVEQVARSMLLPAATSLTNVSFPAPEPGKLVAGNDAGDGFVNKTPVGAGQIVYPVAVGEGGTGATEAGAARANLGLAKVAQAEAEAGTAVDTRAWTAQRVAQAVAAKALTLGRHALSIPAAAWRPQASDGCSEEGAEESGANDVTTAFRAFDPATQEYAQFAFRAPKSSDESAALSGTIVWTEAAGATAHDVVWQVEAQAQGDGDALDGAWGTAVAVTDAGSAGTRRMAPFSGVTPAGGWAEGDTLILRLSRKAGDAADTLDADARFIELQLELTLNAGNDA